MAYELSNSSIKLLAKETGFNLKQIKVVIDLFEDGNTIPFLARYRKEMTGGLDEEDLRLLENKISYQSNLEKSKKETIKKLEEQDNLTPEIEAKINSATQLQEVEDIYYPFRQRRQTRASKAMDRGLEPLADYLENSSGSESNLQVEAEKYMDSEVEGLESIEEVISGAKDIIADRIASDPEIKALARQRYWRQAEIQSELLNKDKDENGTYEQYYDFSQHIKKIPPFRILAMNRGENDEILSVKINPPADAIIGRIKRYYIQKDAAYRQELNDSIEDGFNRLLGPSLEREARSKLTEAAEEHARQVFADNLEALLMQPPLPGRTILGIDPAFRTGCKLAVIDKQSRVLDTGVIYPHQPQNKKQDSLEELKNLINQYEIDAIVTGNGTASRETEELLVDLNKTLSETVPFTIVDEAGASVYSASKISRKELPDMDVSLRGAVSIARRIQDPLAELVKIDPRSVGVGLYQHDIDGGALLKELETVVESVVNRVGIDLNTASPSLLSYIAGFNSSQSSKVCKYRDENGVFSSRNELLDVKGIGPVTYEQAAGFLRLNSEKDPLARTGIHPESYGATQKLLSSLDLTLEDFYNDHKLVVKGVKTIDENDEELAEKLGIGLATFQDIVESLKAPGRDPREKLPKPIFRTDILKIEDLEVGQELRGTVRNVVDFGAFVDIGLKSDGLVHISEMADQYISEPGDVVQPADIVNVKVIDIDRRRERISLSMKGLKN
ncbi:MAG: Tex family protein [Bacillota bacterium]